MKYNIKRYAMKFGFDYPIEKVFGNFNSKSVSPIDFFSTIILDNGFFLEIIKDDKTYIFNIRKNTFFLIATLHNYDIHTIYECDYELINKLFPSNNITKITFNEIQFSFEDEDWYLILLLDVENKYEVKELMLSNGKEIKPFRILTKMRIPSPIPLCGIKYGGNKSLLLNAPIWNLIETLDWI